MPITRAVIPAGGLGTRLLPATKSQPKEMLPVVGTPVVQWVTEELAAAGVRQVLFVTGRRKRAIEDHFDADPELEDALGSGVLLDPRAGMQVLYTRQPRPLGLGDALRHAAGFAGDQPVIVALGDAIMRPPGVIERLADALERHGADAAIAVEEVAPEAVSRYGIVSPGAGLDRDALEVTAVVEKPAPDRAPSRMAVAARYVLGPSVFAALEGIGPGAGGEVQLADALNEVLDSGGRVLAVPLRDGERRLDIGTLPAYCEAFVELALEDPDVGPALRRRLGELLDG